MSLSSIAALVVVLGFAFVLGVSDAPNASAVLISSRAASYRRAMTFSFVAHAAGGLLAGQAVALTMASLVHVPAAQLPGTYLAGGVAGLAFTLLLTRRGIPVSASIALVGWAGRRRGRRGGLGSRRLGWPARPASLWRDRHPARDRRSPRCSGASRRPGCDACSAGCSSAPRATWCGR